MYRNGIQIRINNSFFFLVLLPCIIIMVCCSNYYYYYSFSELFIQFIRPPQLKQVTLDGEQS